MSKSKQLIYDHKIVGNAKGIVDTVEEFIHDDLEKNNTPDKIEIDNQPTFPKTIIKEKSSKEVSNGNSFLLYIEINCLLFYALTCEKINSPDYFQSLKFSNDLRKSIFQKQLNFDIYIIGMLSLESNIFLVNLIFSIFFFHLFAHFEFQIILLHDSYYFHESIKFWEIEIIISIILSK